jgi:hypothetical protein
MIWEIKYIWNLYPGFPILSSEDIRNILEKHFCYTDYVKRMSLKLFAQFVVIVLSLWIGLFKDYEENKSRYLCKKEKKKKKYKKLYKYTIYFKYGENKGVGM